MEAFVSDWKKAQKDPEAFDRYLSSSEEALIIPVLESEEFLFYFVEANIYDYFYYYVPKDVELDDLNFFDYETGIVVAVSKITDFNTIRDEYKMDSSDKYAYDETYNKWYINYNERTIYIDLPSTLIFESYEVIEKYFTFQEIKG